MSARRAEGLIADPSSEFTRADNFDFTRPAPRRDVAEAYRIGRKLARLTPLQRAIAEAVIDRILAAVEASDDS